MTKIGLVLSGSGVYDGSEIHEATLCYYFCDKLGVAVEFFAPDIIQTETVNHLDGSILPESRNCLVEAARIARGNIKAITVDHVNHCDGLIFVGGFGAAKNLSDFAKKGEQCSVQDNISAVIRSFHSQKKPQGFMCIAPVLAASVIPNVTVTLGIDQPMADKIEAMGANSRQALESDVVYDHDHLIYSTPAYMIDTSISAIAIGIEKLSQTVVDVCKKNSPVSHSA